MNEFSPQSILKELQKIPGVGVAVSRDLYALGYRTIIDLKNMNPEEMYARLCIGKGVQVDRCMLYVFRCAVYYASNETHDPELLKWWNWKDRGKDIHLYPRCCYNVANHNCGQTDCVSVMTGIINL